MREGGMKWGEYSERGRELKKEIKTESDKARKKERGK